MPYSIRSKYNGRAHRIYLILKGTLLEKKAVKKDKKRWYQEKR
ncbi:MAG: hypothetical protein SVZ03_03730 [Spirochaetota bacterium]|nr:hypothetical protein [Spirochaetota bacterium]